MPITRLPLSQPIETRDGTLTKDSKSVNGYFESRHNKREFIKRPGLSEIVLDPYLPTSSGQMLHIYNSYLYAAVGGSLYKINPSTYATSSVGTMSGTVQNCYATETLSNSYMFLQNGTYGYTLSSGGTFAKITNDKVVSTTILTGGSGYTTPIVTFSAPPSGTTATGTVQMTSGVVTGITITNGGTGYVTPPSVTISDSGGGTGSGATATCLLNAFPSGPLVPGAVFLDSTIYVATKAGRIYGCQLNDPTSWDALNYISAESEPDNLVGIAKHLNYILGFGEWSIDFFYDAANPTGSPLSVAQSYKSEIGCASGDSIVQFEQTVAWVGRSKTVGPSVYLMEGVSPIKVSTPYIERILGNSTLAEVKAYAFKFNGHMFYVLTLHDLNMTLVFDVNEKTWYQWSLWCLGSEDLGQDPTVYSENYFRPSYYTGYNGVYYLLDDDNGKLYTLSDTQYSDSGAPIFCRCVTDIVDSGTTKRKFYQRVEIIGDKVSATLKIRHTDDDYQTWSNYRTVDLSKTRSQIYQSGSSRRRAWEFLVTDPVPLRLDAAEIDFEIGELEQDQAAPTEYRK
jgi:hypothetical protein